jgi:methionine salvage enolase-phosphatase E1
VDVEGARSAGIAPVLLDRHDLYPDVDAPRMPSIEAFEAWLSGPM